MNSIGLKAELDRIGTTPDRIVLRRWADDEELLVRPLGSGPIERFGHAYYNVYRPDLIEMLGAALAEVTVHLGVEVTGARNDERATALLLADGSTIEADVVVGADGIHSPIRNALFGSSPSRFSGSVAYRALVPRDRVPGLPLEVTNRMGPNSHLVSYFVGEDQRYLNLVCVVPEPEWDVEGWNEPGSVEDLRAHFAAWSPAVWRLLDNVVEPVHRWALHDRPALDRWSVGRVTLLGDSCHAMLPFMAQGACQAIEDAAVLTRSLSAAEETATSGREGPDVPAALRRYEHTRQPRAAEIQKRSWNNATLYHLPDGPDQQSRDQFYGGLTPEDGADAFDWLYGYDALTADLD